MRRSNLQDALYRTRQAEKKVRELDLQLIEARKDNARLVAALASLRIERRAA